MPKPARSFGAVLLVLGFAISPVSAATAGEDLFERKIRPLFVEKCTVCHAEQNPMAGLNLETAAGFLRGADTGPIVVEGEPGKSRLIQAVNYQNKVKMPPTGRLEDFEIAALKTWVELGAPWPGAAQTTTPTATKETGFSQEKLDHWAFQPVAEPKPPSVKNEDWVRSPIDRFILAKLEEEGLDPPPTASKLALLRRAKFDLHGLPPTEAEIEAFLSDSDSGAFGRLVERLLASPRYGEKWGRHWLDVARYADSTGVDEDRWLPHAWRYRDYVIEAFNRDTPFDQFVKEQLAGDLLPGHGSNQPNERGIVATGFLALGPKPLSMIDKKRQVYDVIDEQIDTVSKAFMGLTISCARCHDHKFDPIYTKDYYSMASIFASTRNYKTLGHMSSEIYMEPLVPHEEYERFKAHQERVTTQKRKIEILIHEDVNEFINSELRPRFADYMLAARKVYAEGADAAAVAQEQGLREDVLAKWADYLKPSSEFRPHLDRWGSAGPSELREVAERYERMYEDVACRRDEQLDEWKKKFGEALVKGAVPPGKPGFGIAEIRTDEDRFFAEIAFGEGPFAVPDDQRDGLLDAGTKNKVASMREQLEALEKAAPPEPPMANAVAEGAPVEQAVFIRGSYDNPGEVVPKRFPLVLSKFAEAPPIEGSGRLQLAQWLTGPEHPLTARVMVNRLWHWHFGEGLVRSPNNFGTTGEVPTHPQLLDYLAREFVRAGWSLKHMHRTLMLTSTYQMSSIGSRKAERKDPGNRLWSRFRLRRLTVEEMRDAFLALDGSLDLKMGKSLAGEFQAMHEYAAPPVDLNKSLRRTVYLPLIRNKMPSTMNLFEFADTTTSSGKRTENSIAPQALYMMNSDFVRERSRSFAKYLLEGGEDDAARVRRAHLIALTREPTNEEVSERLVYLRNYPLAGTVEKDNRLQAWQSLCRALLAANEFHYVD